MNTVLLSVFKKEKKTSNNKIHKADCYVPAQVTGKNADPPCDFTAVAQWLSASVHPCGIR